MNFSRHIKIASIICIHNPEKALFTAMLYSVAFILECMYGDSFIAWV